MFHSWSFGICLWEIFTLGGTPYHRIGTECLVDFLSEGNRMESPQGCPEEFYTIMQDCWRKETKDRPSFAELSVQIGEIIERHASEVSSEFSWHRIGLFQGSL